MKLLILISVFYTLFNLIACQKQQPQGPYITPVPSGVVITSREKVYRIRAYADIYVRLQTQLGTPVSSWKTMLRNLKGQIHTALTSTNVSLTTLDNVLNLRLMSLNRKLDKMAASQRTKRSVLENPASELIGGAAHFLGLATADDIETLAEISDQLAGAIDGVVTVQKKTIAKVNEIGKAQNRLVEQVNDLTAILNSHGDTLRFIQEEMQVMRKAIKITQFVTQVIVFLNTFEDELNSYSEQCKLIISARAACESGSVSEQLIPTAILTELINNHGNRVAVEAHAYYQYLTVKKLILQNGDDYCVVQAPLLDAEEQEKYHLSTFPVCGESGCYKIYQDTTMVLSTLNALLYYPEICYGRMPPACQPGVVFSKNQQLCLHGLISGDIRQQKECPIIYTAHPDPPHPILTKTKNRYVLRTDTTTYHYRCSENRPKTGPIEAGVYVITIDPECELDAGTWLLHGISTYVEHFNISVTPPEPIDLPYFNVSNVPMDKIKIPLGIKQLEFHNYTDLVAPSDSHLQEDVRELAKNLHKKHYFWVWIILGIICVILVSIFIWKVIALKKAGLPLKMLFPKKMVHSEEPKVHFDPKAQVSAIYPALPKIPPISDPYYRGVWPALPVHGMPNAPAQNPENVPDNKPLINDPKDDSKPVKDPQGYDNEVMFTYNYGTQTYGTQTE